MEIDEDMENDPVVAEVDVHLSKQLGEYLYVFQYPLYSGSQAPYDVKYNNMACRIRPIQKKVEVDLPIDTRAPTYDQVKAEELAQLSLGESPSEVAIAASQFPSGRMDKYTLRSSLVDIGTHYCIATVDKTGVHLTPVSSIVQLRPGFQYLDTPEPAAEATDDAAAGEDDEEEAVTVKVQTTRERKMAARRAAQAEPDETWVNLKVFSRNRPEANQMRKRLVEPATGEMAEFATTRADYIKALRAASSSDHKADAGTDAVFSQNSLLSMPLDQRVRAILRSVEVVKTHTVAELCGATEEDVLPILQDLAVLVHGNWVVKSEVLYPEGYKSPASAAPAEAMRNARDFILYNLHARPNTRPDGTKVWRERESAHSRPQEHFRGVDASAVYADEIATHFDASAGPRVAPKPVTTYLKRSDVARFLGPDTKLSAEDIRDMLKGVAVQVLSQGWAFRYDTDERFVAEQPRIVERQAELLKLKHQSVTSTTPAHTRRISASQTHAAASSGPDHHALLKAHFEKEGVVTLTAVRQFCHQHNIGRVEMEAVLKEIAAEVAVEWYTEDKVYVLAGDDPVRQIILSMFCTSKTIKRKDAMEECKRVTGQELSATSWNKIINGLADRKGAAWEFRLP